MQILWLSHVVPYPPKAGVLIRCFYLLRAVARRHDVDLVAFIQEPLLKTFYPSVADGLAESRKVLEGFCRSVTFIPIESLQRPFGRQRTAIEGLVSDPCYSLRWLQSSLATQRLQELAARHKYDLAHFDTIGLAPYRKLFKDTPSTLGYHNIESHMLLRRATVESNVLRKAYYWQEGRRLREYEKKVAGTFATHITCSDLDGERLRSVTPAVRTVTIPNGVDVDFFTPTDVPQRAAVIFIGTMSWYPNIDAVLFLLREIWPKLHKTRPDATLDIVGAGSPQSIVDLASQHPEVTLHGYVPDIRPLFDRAALFVCPIRDGGGTKLKILDALSMGKCIVAHPIACEGIDVVDGRDVVLATTAAQFAEAIAGLLADPERRRALGLAARKLAIEKYGFDAIGADLVKTFEQAANLSA